METFSNIKTTEQLPEPTFPEGTFSIGGGHRVCYIYDDNNMIIGLQDFHLSSVNNALWCGGTIFFKPYDEDGWKLWMIKPIDLSPSINCDRCNSHGVIVRGKWLGTQTPEDFLRWDPDWMPPDHILFAWIFKLYTGININFNDNDEEVVIEQIQPLQTISEKEM